MAKPFVSGVVKGQYPYPSIFGSHRSMVVTADDVVKMTEELNKTDPKNEDEKKRFDDEKKRLTSISAMLQECQDGHCICADEFGEYKTEIKRLDNGAADPERYRESRLGKLFVGKEKKDDKK